MTAATAFQDVAIERVREGGTSRVTCPRVGPLTKTACSAVLPSMSKSLARTPAVGTIRTTSTLTR